MTAVAHRYQENAVCYYQAAEKLWQSDGPFPEEHLLAPTLQCLGYAFEIGLKAVLIAESGNPEKIGRSFSHRLNDLWDCESLERVRRFTEVAADHWEYKAHWPQEGTKFERFMLQFRWLGRIHAGLNEDGEYKGDFALRYPVASETKVHPPDYLLQAAGSILGFVEDDIHYVGKMK